MYAFVMLLLFGISHLRAQPPVIAGPIQNPSNGHTYYLLSADTWSNSEAKAQSLGGHLATIRNAAEDSWIFSTFGSYVHGGSNGLWLGGVWSQGIDSFAWISGKPVAYSHWSSGEPNGIFGLPPDQRAGKEGLPQYLQVFGPDDYRAGEWNDQYN